MYLIVTTKPGSEEFSLFAASEDIQVLRDLADRGGIMSDDNRTVQIVKTTDVPERFQIIEAI